MTVGSRAAGGRHRHGWARTRHARARPRAALPRDDDARGTPQNVAGLFEVGWAIGPKYTEGFTRLWPSVATVVAMAVSVTLLGWAVRSLPVGTAYAVWTAHLAFEERLLATARARSLR